jgi:four helix bundle protein
MINFIDLKIWVRSHNFVLEIYKITQSFPDSEKYNLTSQVRRAASSIPINIAEGCGRNSDGELERFLNFSMGSASEVEYLILLSKDLEYIDLKTYEDLKNELIEIKKMLNVFIQKVNSRR